MESKGSHFYIEKNTRILLVLLVCVFTLALTYIKSIERDTDLYLEEMQNKLTLQHEVFDGLQIKAHNIYIYNFTTDEELYSKLPNQEKYIASLSKIMTAVTAERTGLEEITVSKEALIGFENNGINTGDVWDAKTLGKIMLVSSSNNAAEIFQDFFNKKTDSSFVEKMNYNAQKFGLDNTHFINPTGLDEGVEGNKSTAKDITKLTYIAFKRIPDIAEATTQNQFLFDAPEVGSIGVSNTNVVTDQVPNLLFSKTGYTDNAGGTLSVLYKSPYNGDTIGITVLDSTRDARFSDVLTLIKRTELYLHLQQSRNII